ncbi:unnamed protein product, partial [Prorocentrum cordatum]
HVRGGVVRGLEGHVRGRPGPAPGGAQRHGQGAARPAAAAPPASGLGDYPPVRGRGALGPP